MQMNSNFRGIKNKTKNFTIIDNAILQDKNLSLRARGLLCFMLHLPETWVFNERGLATITGETRHTIRSGLKELMNNKYLYRVQMRGNGGEFGSMMYYLFETPTELEIDGKIVETETDTPTNDKYIIDKTHPDYDYLQGGWMYE